MIKKNFNISLTPEIKQQAHKQAIENNEALSTLIERLLIEYLKKRK